ncbi:MAG UNVERIFIED_CONTAM: hypothetical protein LVQ98_00515 [Rickettsiaceae bacterium]|jgi:hypothetical protein
MIKALKTRNNIVIAWLYYAIPLTPILAMISGLFMAPWMGLNILILIFALGINLHDVRTQLRPIERIVITFSVASCFWSIAPIESFATLSRLILVMAIIYVILPNKKLLQSGPDLLNFRFKLGIIMAIFVFLIEKYTDGAIYRTIRSVIQPDSKNHFGLYWLDRGAAVLSLSAWAPIYIFLKSREIWKAILFYICILTTLILSDSTSSLLAFIIAGIITLLLYISSMRLAKVFSFCDSIFLCYAFICKIPRPICNYLKI